MTLRKSILTILLLLFTVTTYAQTQQRSDYQIQKEFKENFKQYNEKLEEISSSDSAQALIKSIHEFEIEYMPHKDLLNKALHPETYDQKMEELKKSSVMAKNRLETIEQQNEQVQTLQDQLTSYEQDMQQLNSRTDSLRKEMQKSIASEKQLSEMLRTYRNSLEKRDELILAFIDSMVVAYQQMDLKSVQDLENIDNRSQLESDGDALELIHKITTENLNILESNTNLHLEDYMRMSEVQREFQKMWTSLGSKIKEVYDGENADQVASEIDQNISEWNQMLTDRTFTALNDSLGVQQISVGEFQDGQSLYANLNSYLDNKITQSEENATQSNYEDFQRFRRFWNMADIQWSSNLVDAGILSNQQMATLNQKVDTWGENARPSGQNNILVYLLGASVLLAVALGVMLIREKKNKDKSGKQLKG
jgi:hypothetical protein